MSEPTQGEELHELAMKIRYDLTSAQAKLTELVRQIAILKLDRPAKVVCDYLGCGQKFPGPRTLAEHVYHNHNGPEPEHWLAIEAMSAEPPDEPQTDADEEPDLAPRTDAVT